MESQNPWVLTILGVAPKAQTVFGEAFIRSLGIHPVRYILAVDWLMDVPSVPIMVGVGDLALTPVQSVQLLHFGV